MSSSQEWICKGKIPPQVVEIDDPDNPHDPNLIAPETEMEVPDETDGTRQVSTLATEWQCISTRVRSQPDTYTPITTGKIMNMPFHS